VRTESDEELMRRVAEGDVDKLGVLFERHYARVHSLCYRLTRSADVADDLAQDTMLRVLRSATSFRGDAAFTTWLFRLAYNTCQDHWRRTRRDENTTDLSEVEDVSGEPASNETDERHALLEQAMERLAPDRRSVLVLSRYHDLAYDDIARVLDCTPAAARVRAHRALNELREIYRELERRQHGVR
jgi:RNA polymerase sigma-70 factor (ECF subfamily)